MLLVYARRLEKLPRARQLTTGVLTGFNSKLLASKLNQYSDLSLLQYLNQSMNVTIEPWLTLDAGVDATHDKLVAYQDSSENLEIVIPQEFEQFAPQQDGLRFEIPVHMRFGGVTIRYPKAISYMSVLNTSL